MRKAFLGILTILVLALSLSSCGLADDIKSVQQVSEDFMTALKERDYDAAFRLFSSDLQEEIGDAATLQSLAEANGVLPESWSFTNTNISTENGETTGTVEGTVTYEDGGTGELQIYTLKVEAVTTVWILVGFNLTR